MGEQQNYLADDSARAARWIRCHLPEAMLTEIFVLWTYGPGSFWNKTVHWSRCQWDSASYMRHIFGKQRLCILSGRRMLTLLGNASQCSESHKLSWETLATSCQCLKKIMSCDPHRNRKYLFKVQGDNARMQTWRTKSKQDSNSNANDPLNLHDRNLSCYSDIFPGTRIISIIWILLSISSEDHVCKGERQIFIFGRCDFGRSVEVSVWNDSQLGYT